MVSQGAVIVVNVARARMNQSLSVEIAVSGDGATAFVSNYMSNSVEQIALVPR